ncbi:motility associated factor glycosyltransferase family protein [Clostridium paridis]|uniref:Motility associated factor glycosyltransferase family protein n=1 Tax=Clostridium paridis TaxID=2803863 RepID=A0A937FIS1_9CLOT|nr:6-hydroxymethylpterin diphosphokinase MptE-like protein [Clostridium paridis]MBL4932913.1 motility associated factor glycosyltransferase family protein [Clostridium paridis]
MKIENCFDKINNIELLKLIEDNRSVYLGSKYNMKREISSFKNKFEKINKKYQVVIFGASGGKWIEEFADEFTDRDIVFVEPLKELKDEVKKSIKNLKVDVKVLSLEDEDFRRDLKASIKRRYIEFIVFSNYDLTFPKEVYYLKELIKECVIDKTIDENTVIAFSKTWFVNYLGNLPSIVRDETLSQYKNLFEKKPAIIVSAGPSLEKNLHLLKGNEDKFVIITGIRTLSTLKNEGIEADFACVIDGSEAMYNVSKDAIEYDTPLLYSEGANKKIIKEHKGKTIHFTSPNYYELNQILGNFGEDVLFQGGSVSHSCVSIADYLGCDPIIFIGQDLAHTNNQVHAKKATMSGEKLHADNYDLYVKDIYGNDVPTTYSLDSFRKSFEDFIKITYEKHFINATEGGADIKGTEIKTLKEVIEGYTEKIDKTSINEPKSCNIDISLVKNNLKDILLELIRLKKSGKEAVLENKNLLKNFMKGNKQFHKCLNRLDKIDELFAKKQQEFLLLNSLFAPILKEIDVAFYSDEIDNFKDEVTHIKFVAEKGKTLYESINDRIEFAIPYIEDAIENLEEIING